MKKYENFCAALKNMKEIYDDYNKYKNITSIKIIRRRGRWRTKKI